MPKALVVEENQLRHLLKVSTVSGESPIRNVALVYVLYGTGMMLTEIGSITVRDYLREDGAVRASSEVRAEIAYNSNARMLHWSSPRVVAALDAYLAERIRLSHGLTVRKAAFRGLDPDGQLFRRGDGEPFQLTARKTATGKLSYSCDSLSQLYRKLHSQAGLHSEADKRTARARNINRNEAAHRWRSCKARRDRCRDNLRIQISPFLP
jgi:hypothetical protein